VLDLFVPVLVSIVALVYGAARVLSLFYRAGVVIERAREAYFRQRLASATARDAWLDYKAVTGAK
jgi:hypothetical protein